LIQNSDLGSALKERVLQIRLESIADLPEEPIAATVDNRPEFG
jgi:hypothetical protein